MSRVSKKWKLLSEDQSLWKQLYFSLGWTVNQSTIQRYLFDNSRQKTPIKRLFGSSSTHQLSSIPLARTTATLYNPSSLPTMPGAPNRIRSFKRLLYRNNNDNNVDISPSTSSINRTEDTSSSEGNSSVVIRPTHISRSHPLLQQRHQNTREIISQTIVERSFANRPLPRKNGQCDDAQRYHYREIDDVRYINWKRLYQNRALIEKRWQNGEFKLCHFPATDPTVANDQTPPNSGIYCLQFNAHMLVTGSRAKSIDIWDIKTGQHQSQLEGHHGSVLCLQFDDRYLISGSSDSTLIIWDIQTGKRIKKLTGHQESVLNVKFVDNLIVSCSKDRTVRTWDLEKGTCLNICRGHRAAVNAVQFREDRIVSASGDRSIKIWDLV